MNNELESHINRLNGEYKNHQNEVQSKLGEIEQANQESRKLKEEMVSWRQDKQLAMIEVMEQSEKYEAKFTFVNEEKNALRGQLSDMQKLMREIQRQIAATELENQALKSLIAGESELREERAQEEQQSQELVLLDLKIHS